ncbi:MAG TPA: phosphate ABC transporter substrate-binding protein [Syntrophobacteraceae bacterium]|nr:phosphate ABC transporter substrate-binding protein [Syntrophobacteraceae bacterium]
MGAEAYPKHQQELGRIIMKGQDRKRNNRVLTIGFTCVIVAICAVTEVRSQELKVGSGAAATENVFKKIQGPMETSLGIKLSIVASGPVEALKDLDKGTVMAAAGGLAVSDWMALMEKSGYKIADPNAYKSYIIGKDIVRVIVNKEVNASYFSKSDLKGIFTGAVSNWKAINGQDIPIQVVWGDKIPGTQELFQKEMMGGEAYAKSKLVSGTAAEVKEMVVRTRGAVGLAPMSLLDASVSAPRGPEVSRPITLLTKGEPSPLVTKMLEFLNGEGKKYLSQ